MMGRTNGLGTPVARSNEPTSSPTEPVKSDWTQDQIAQHLAKYPPYKMRVPKREPLYERSILR